MAKLRVYQGLLSKWQKNLNLVAQSTLKDSWNRHFEDSLQLINYLPENTPIWDLGSGAGFPGLVLSILGYDVTLVEKDAKKCIFLKEVARQCGATPKILTTRLEEIEDTLFPENGWITARAFAPLDRLFEWTKQFEKKNPTYLLLKGENVDSEIEKARNDRYFDLETIKSRTNPEAKILKMENIKSFSSRA